MFVVIGVVDVDCVCGGVDWDYVFMKCMCGFGDFGIGFVVIVECD